MLTCVPNLSQLKGGRDGDVVITANKAAKRQTAVLGTPLDIF